MAELKTRPTDSNVDDFINNITDAQRREDCQKLRKVMTDITGDSGVLWSSSIVGFGTYIYTYSTGRTGEWMLTGFSPRKQALTLYIMAGFGEYEELLNKLGNFKLGKSCLYIQKLDDIDSTILRKLITLSVAAIKKRYA